MRWCNRCVLPSTRPRLPFNKEGICGACLAYEQRKNVDWAAREEEWHILVDWAKNRKKPYDALLPISGGKDSFAQAIRCLDSGLHVLGYTWQPDLRTELGQKNLDALIGLGMDHYELTINPLVMKKLYLKSFEEYGSDAVTHGAVYYSAMAMAYRFETPLVIWSENSAEVYSGGEWAERDGGAKLDTNWIAVHGSTAGAVATDWMWQQGCGPHDVTPFWCPSDSLMAQKSILPVFMGYYFDFDPVANYEIARLNGFQAAVKPLTGIWNFADVDDPLAACHHFLKAPKFALLREMDNLSMDIRAGRVTRDRAIEILRERGLVTPWSFIDALCMYAGKPTAWFWEIVDKFRDERIWKRQEGDWTVPGFLIEGFDWGALVLSKTREEG